MNNRSGIQKILALILFFLFMKYVVYNTTYIGRDDGMTNYYICQNNSEVAQLLGQDKKDFDLSTYNVVVRKTEKRTDDVGIYVVMINIDNSFVVCYRAEEYDIFFYSWDFEQE